MAESRMVIVNGTDDDAVCKVSGGGGVPNGPVKDMEWRVPKKKTLQLPPLPAACTLHFSISIGNKRVTPAIHGLKLTKDKNKYRIEVVKNGTKPS